MTDVDDPPELLILDLDMPYVSGPSILEELENQRSPLPVMIHTFHMEYEKHPSVQKAAGFWEKCKDDIDGLRATVTHVLRKYYPLRFLSKCGTKK